MDTDNSKFRKTTILIGLAFLALIHTAKAQNMTVTGGPWNVNVNQLTVAGSNYAQAYEDAGNTITHTIPLPLITLGWMRKIHVSYQESNTWHNNLKVFVKRDASTAGTLLCLGCTASGGETYKEVTANNIELYRLAASVGLLNFDFKIKIQLKVEGVSVVLPPKNYSRTLYFTITD